MQLSLSFVETPDPYVARFAVEVSGTDSLPAPPQHICVYWETQQVPPTTDTRTARNKIDFDANRGLISFGQAVLMAHIGIPIYWDRILTYHKASRFRLVLTGCSDNATIKRGTAYYQSWPT